MCSRNFNGRALLYDVIPWPVSGQPHRLVMARGGPVDPPTCVVVTRSTTMLKIRNKE